MKNFELLATGLDVKPLLKKLEQSPELWREITLRQEYPGSAHSDTETIVVRGPRSFTREDYFFDFGAYNYPAMYKLEEEITVLIWPILKQLQVKELGRLLIVKLKPHGVVGVHIDEGEYADHFSRFHICLQGEESTLTAYSETKHFYPGEAWWFNHKSIHYGNNNSDVPRIHIIFDAVSPLYPMNELLEANAQHQAVAQTLGMGKVFL